MRSVGAWLVVGSLGSVLWGCGTPATSAPPPPPEATQASVVPNVVAGSSANGGALRVGSPKDGSLESLQYFILNLQLCQELTLNGSGYSDATGCIRLYENAEASAGTLPTYDDYLVTQAEADTTPGRYVDLLSEEGRAALRVPMPLGASAVGTYRYGLVNFYRPIKFKGRFPVVGGADDQFFRTKAVSSIVAGPATGGFQSEQVRVGDTLTGDAEQTTYMLNNGGSWFVFQRPFEITQADLDAAAQIQMDLVFNPENFGQAYELAPGQSCASVNASICDEANGVVFEMPFVRMNPVPRKGAGSAARKEVYLVDYGTGEAQSKLRVELYYDSSDAEKRIQGVDVAIVYGAGATRPVNNVVASYFVSQTGEVSTADATVSLLDTTRAATLQGLVRGQSGTAEIVCRFVGEVCPSIGAVVSAPYTFVEDLRVSGE